MRASILCYLGLIYCGAVSFTLGFLGPRTARPLLPRSSSSQGENSSLVNGSGAVSTTIYVAPHRTDYTTNGLHVFPGIVTYTTNTWTCGNQTTTVENTSPFPDFEQLCVLWNSTCTGNTIAASSVLAYPDFQYNICFMDPKCQCSLNGKAAPEASTSSLYQILSYMRSPECHRWHFEPPDDRCCGTCNFNAVPVDIYYWPSKNASTSCLSIIGESIHPWDYGATTTTEIPRGRTDEVVLTYWGCEAEEYPYDRTYASMVTTNGMTWKSSNYNPWGPDNPCSRTSEWNIERTVINTLTTSTRIRAGSLVLPPDSLDGNGFRSPSTLSMNGHTFTSPSVYIKFRGIQATDSCGPIGSILAPRTTLIAFDPEELSTIEPRTGIVAEETTKAFRLEDLPCPPQSAMEANWYKPAPGEPYIPLLAFPSKLLTAIDPLWSTCMGHFFTGYDPPRTLTPVSALGASTTVETSKATQSANSKGSIVMASATAEPVSTPKPNQPKQTTTGSVAAKTTQGDSDSKPSQTVRSKPSHGSQSTERPQHASIIAHTVSKDPTVVGDTGSNVRPSGTSERSTHIAFHRPLNPLDPFSNLVLPSATHTSNPVFEIRTSRTTPDSDNPITVSSKHAIFGDATLKDGDTFSKLAVTAVSSGTEALIGESVMLPSPQSQYQATAIDSVSNSVAPDSLKLPASQATTTTIAGHGATFLSDAVVNVGTTLTQGAQPITLSNMVTSLDSIALVLESTTLSSARSGHTSMSDAEDTLTTSLASVQTDAISTNPGDAATGQEEPSSSVPSKESTTSAISAASSDRLVDFIMGAFGAGPFASSSSPVSSSSSRSRSSFSFPSSSQISTSVPSGSSAPSPQYSTPSLPPTTKTAASPSDTTLSQSAVASTAIAAAKVSATMISAAVIFAAGWAIIA